MKRIFVDTWAWYALTDSADADHSLAQLANEQLLDEGYTFVTTNFVLAEAVTLVRYNLHHSAAVCFWHTLQQLVEDELVEMVGLRNPMNLLPGKFLSGIAIRSFPTLTVPLLP